MSEAVERHDMRTDPDGRVRGCSCGFVGTVGQIAAHHAPHVHLMNVKQENARRAASHRIDYAAPSNVTCACGWRGTVGDYIAHRDGALPATASDILAAAEDMSVKPLWLGFDKGKSDEWLFGEPRPDLSREETAAAWLKPAVADADPGEVLDNPPLSKRGFGQ